jgi:hypothetical protein
VTAVTAPALFDDLPPAPTRDDLLDKADRAKRLALDLPEPHPLELDAEIAPVTHCPTCGCDVSGCTESTTASGQRYWQRPQGLTHHEGGRRCLSDARSRA